MRLKWTVEFEVDEVWIRDGFDLDDERAKDMLASDLQYATYSEIDAKVIARPDVDTLQKVADGEIGDAVGCREKPEPTTS